MISASEKAVQKLRDNLIGRCIDAGLGFRVANDAREPGQMAFSIKVDHEKPGDTVVEAQGIKIFIAAAAAASLGDCELDYLGESAGGFCLKGRKLETPPYAPELWN